MPLGDVPPPTGKPASLVARRRRRRRSAAGRARPRRCRTRRAATAAAEPSRNVRRGHVAGIAGRVPAPCRDARRRRGARSRAVAVTWVEPWRRSRRRGRPLALRGRRTAGRGARRRLLAAGGAAGPPRRPLAEGRLQPAGPVRLLHGAGRRPAPGGLRDPGPAGGRPRRSRPSTGLDATSAIAGRTRSAPPAPASAGSARRGSSCAWPALRARRGPPTTGRGRPGAARPPVPLHRAGGRSGRRALAVGRRRRRRRRSRPRRRAARRAAIEGGAPQRVGARRGARPGRLRRRHRAARRARRRARRPTASGRSARRSPRPAPRPARCRAGARPRR